MAFDEDPGTAPAAMDTAAVLRRAHQSDWEISDWDRSRVLLFEWMVLHVAAVGFYFAGWHWWWVGTVTVMGLVAVTLIVREKTRPRRSAAVMRIYDQNITQQQGQPAASYVSADLGDLTPRLVPACPCGNVMEPTISRPVGIGTMNYFRCLACGNTGFTTRRYPGSTP